MTATCRIEIDFHDEEEVRSILRSIELDNGPFAQTRGEGKKLIIDAEAKNMRSLLHTLEDLMACLKVAEGMVKLK